MACGTDDPGTDIAQRAKALPSPGPDHRAVGRMSTRTFDIDDDRKRLDIARRLYQALVAQNPDRLIMLCDAGGCVLARNERLPKEDAAEKAS